ncbi:MAG: hypothetical protein DMF78_01295 [Acidobacteria bacterium]|nr:MAG: hypothetical protein DMF78_01295 [Acidobacteriota bacterium]
MLIARVVVETLPGHARTVAERMSQMSGMGSLFTESDRRVVADWRVPSCDTREGLSEVLQAMNPEIVEVCPTLIVEED